MTVEELIEELKRQDPKANITVHAEGVFDDSDADEEVDEFFEIDKVDTVNYSRHGVCISLVK